MVRALALVTLLQLSACSPAPAPLANTFDSASAVAGAVLSAMTAGDSAALASLALSEQEFRDHIWPALPAARPERNLPFSYVWGDLRQKSAASLRGAMDRLRGQRLTLVDVRLGPPTAYDGYTVHRDAVFVVRESDGVTREERVCGSLVEQQGRWKVFSYVIDD